MSEKVEVVQAGKLTAEYLALSPLAKWETLVLQGLIGTDEPWIEDMRQALKSLAHSAPPLEGEAAEVVDLRKLLRHHQFVRDRVGQEGCEVSRAAAEYCDAIEAAAALIERLSAEKERLAEARALLADLEHTFRWYADLHAQKATTDGMNKAKRNEEHANRIAAFLATTETQEKGK